MSQENGDAVPSVPLWKNPFAIAFVIGVTFLTALPFLQRRFLKAPPPLAQLEPWALVDQNDLPIGSETLKGKVWLVSFLSQACTPQCLARQEAFGKLASHLDDFGDKTALVSFVVPSAEPPTQIKDMVKHSRWYLARGTADVLESVLINGFRNTFVSIIAVDAGVSSLDFADVPAIALVDQRGAIRGFWRDDEVGRGNAVNAARLLARYGPNP